MWFSTQSDDSLIWSPSGEPWPPSPRGRHSFDLFSGTQCTEFHTTPTRLSGMNDSLMPLSYDYTSVSSETSSVSDSDSGNSSEKSELSITATGQSNQVSDATMAGISVNNTRNVTHAGPQTPPNAAPEQDPGQEISDDTIAEIRGLTQPPQSQPPLNQPPDQPPPDPASTQERDITIPQVQSGLPEIIAAALTQLTARLGTTNDTERENEELKRQVANLARQAQDLERQLAKSKDELRTCLEKLEDRDRSLQIERSLRLRLEMAMDKNRNRKEDLIIGSSIIRDLDESLYKDTKVVATSGATPDDLTSTLKTLSSEGKSYKRIAIVAGGNQLRDNPENVSDTINSMKATIAAAKEISDRVAICELPPRMNSDKAAEAIQMYNLELRTLTSETESDFIETSPVFHLANGLPNDGYMDKDQVHVNLRGSAKLVECMKVEMKDSEANKKVSKFAAYKRDQNLSPPPIPQQQAQAQVPSQRQAYAQVAAKPQNQQPGRRPQNQPRQNNRANQPTKPPPPSWQQQNPTENVNNGQTTQEQPQKDNINRPRPPPLQVEYGFCGYCGETGHRHLDCRCGGPVKCHNCGVRTHKAKFCHLYQ